MKNLSGVVRSILFKAMIVGLAGIAVSPVPAGLVAHYRFDDSINDATGKYHAQLRDPLEIPLYEEGKSGKAVLIDSAGTSLQVDASLIQLNQDFTIAAWVKTLKGGEVCVLYKGPAASFGLLSRNPVGFEILQKSFDRSGGG
jgi:hypothetical protein